MELKKLVIFLLVSVSTSLGQEAEEPTGDYLVQLKFSLREERVPSIVNYLLNNSLEMHDIQTADIIKLSKLDRYDLGRFAKRSITTTSPSKKLSPSTLWRTFSALWI
jgi:hypothetical protein